MTSDPFGVEGKLGGKHPMDPDFVDDDDEMDEEYYGEEEDEEDDGYRPRGRQGAGGSRFLPDGAVMDIDDDGWLSLPRLCRTHVLVGELILDVELKAAKEQFDLDYKLGLLHCAFVRAVSSFCSTSTR